MCCHSVVVVRGGGHCECCAGLSELIGEVDSLCSAVAEFDVVEPVPRDDDAVEISRQLDLCMVRIVMSHVHVSLLPLCDSTVLVFIIFFFQKIKTGSRECNVLLRTPIF